MPLEPPAGFYDPQPSESTPTESVDIDPDNAVLVQFQDQGIQVNLPKGGVDVRCQFHAKGEQVMMKLDPVPRVNLCPRGSCCCVKLDSSYQVSKIAEIFWVNQQGALEKQLDPGR